MSSPQALFRKATLAALAGATVVTSNERAALALRRACEQRMAASGKPWHTPRVLSWGTFNTWLWREATIIGAVQQVLLSRDQQRVLWEDIIAQSADGARLMNTAGAAVRAREAWELIHSYRVPFPSPLFDRAPETKAFAAWASELSRTCVASRWIDSARVSDELARVAESLKPVLSWAVTYGFDDFTPQQTTFLQALRGAGIRVEQLTYVAQLRLDCTAEADHVRLLATDDAQDEVRHTASWARDHLRQKPSSQIGIVLPRIGDARAHIEHILLEVLHPESFFSGYAPAETLFELSASTQLIDHGIADTALRALRFAAACLPMEEALRLLRSPYIYGAAEERSARAELDLLLRRYAKTPQITPIQLLDSVRDSNCHRLKRCLEQFVAKCAPFTSLHTPGKWAQHMSAALTAIGWPGGASARELEVHEAFLELLRRFSALEVVRPDAIDARQAVQEVTTMARDQRFRAKRNSAPIQVMTLSELAGSVCDALWICGMTDDAWPPHGATNPFIPLALQAQYELPHSSSEAERLAASAALARSYASAPEVIVSWPKRDKEREFRPSPQVAHLSVASPAVCEPLAPAISAALPPSASDQFQDEQAPAATPGVQPGGTKLFELQSTCPFRAFGETRLSARKMNEAYAGPGPIDRGNLMETILQRVWTELGDWKGFDAMFGTLDFQPVVERAVDTTIRECFPQPGRWFDNFRTIERARVIRLTMHWFAMERARPPFDRVEHQQERDITIGGVMVKGRIDRIDHLPGGDVVVIDYKTGDNISAKHWDTPRMDKPQLPLYAVAEPAGRVAAVAFGIVRTERCDLAGYGRSRDLLGKASGQCERNMTELINEWREEFDKLAASYLAGDAAVRPKSHKTCQWCPLGATCRVREQVAAEVNGDE